MSPNWCCRGNIMRSLCRDLWLQTPQKDPLHTHTHFKMAFLQQYSALFLFSIEEKHVGDGLRENNGGKETNLKGIDFLILINTFPLLRAFLWPDTMHFSDVVRKRNFEFAFFHLFWVFFSVFFIAKAQTNQLNCCNERKQEGDLFLCDLEHQREGGIPPHHLEITRSGLRFVWTSPHRQRLCPGAMTHYKNKLLVNSSELSARRPGRLCGWAQRDEAFHKPTLGGSNRWL